MPHESLNTHGLPFLPRNQINLNQNQDYKKKHHCDVKAGSRIVDIEKLKVITKIQSIIKTAQLDKVICHFIAQDVMNNELYTVSYYLEDETIRIASKKVVILERIVARKNRDDLLTITEMQLGDIVKIYGKAYKLLKLDSISKNYLQGYKIDLGSDLSVPDFHVEPVQKVYKPEKHFGLKQFIEYDKKVLRFYGIWDDTASLFGEKHYLIVLYYLTDNSVEVHEHTQGNKNHSKSFLSRSKLQKQNGVLYDPKDFELGKFVSLYSRDILIYDCDVFTEQFFKTELQTSLLKPQLVEQQDSSKLEDSKAKVKVSKFYKDRKYENEILRFHLTCSRHGYDDRKFSLSFFPFDDTCSVYEVKQANTGIPGGLFMKRSKAYCSDGSVFGCLHIGVGQVIRLVGLEFTIGECDQYTFKFMTEHPDEFVQ